MLRWLIITATMLSAVATLATTPLRVVLPYQASAQITLTLHEEAGLIDVLYRDAAAIEGLAAQRGHDVRVSRKGRRLQAQPADFLAVSTVVDRYFASAYQYTGPMNVSGRTAHTWTLTAQGEAAERQRMRAALPQRSVWATERLAEGLGCETGWAREGGRVIELRDCGD